MLRENLDCKRVLAGFEATLERDFHHIRVSMAEQHILGFDAIEFFLLLLALLDITMKFAVFRNRMSPELTAATGFLTNLKLNALLLFVLR